MQTYEKSLDPKTLKLNSILKEGSKTKQQISLSLLNKIFRLVLAAVSNRNELKVWQRLDRSGHTWWYASDPATGSSTCVATENEMRAWIEQRYYK